MKVVEFVTKNFKAVREVHFSPDSTVVTIAGDNGAGKSSILQALASALGGKTYQPERPVRQGADRAEIGVALDDGTTIDVRIRPDGSRTLEVRDAAGVAIRSPQDWLNARVRALSFDPLAFMREPPKGQSETLRKLVGLDLSQLDAQTAALEAERLVQGRERDKAEGAAKMLPRWPEVPKAEVSLADLHVRIGELRGAAARKAEFAAASTTAADNAAQAKARSDSCRQRADNRDAKEASERERLTASAQADTDRIDSEIADLLDRLRDVEVRRNAVGDRLQTSIVAMVADLDQRQRELIDAATEHDAEAQAQAQAATVARDRSDAIVLATPDDLQAEVVRIEVVNRKVRDNATAATADEIAQREAATYRDLTQQIEALRDRRKQLIAACKMPVEGLSFDDDGRLTFRGAPIADASHAEQVRLTMAISMALHKEAPIVLLDEANSLDANSLRIVHDMAVERGAQVWMVRIDGGEGAVVIEDGEIRRPS